MDQATDCCRHVTGILPDKGPKDVRMLAFCYQLPYEMFAYGGMPRWLIRKQFEEFLPKSILNRWQQHGALNIDWIGRIYRDWDKVKEALLEDLSVDILDEWFDKKRVYDAIENFGKNKEKDKYAITYICAIVSILRFMRLQK